MRIWTEERSGDDEERGRRTCGDENVIGRERIAIPRYQPAQALRAQVLAVRKEQTPDVGLHAVVGEAHVGERALRKVVPDRRVAELFR